MWRQLIHRLLTRFIRVGALEITYSDGTVRRYGTGGGPSVAIALKSPSFERRIVLHPDLVLGEGYVSGELEIVDDDLRGFLEILLRNRTLQGEMGMARLISFVRTFLRFVTQYNPVGRAKRNVAHHYDLSAQLYDLFLDEDRQYSCAYFQNPQDSLEQAQLQKKRHIAQKLELAPGMRVLDIGCGWGGMALTLAQEYGVHVTGVTLSEEQYKLARQRVKAAGLEDQIDIRLSDYRDVDEVFDRIVSVGMFEHVGAPHYGEYFRHVRQKLTDNGVALIHTIGRGTPPGATSRWITKYIFPGGYCPSLSEVAASVERQYLWITDVEVLRLHYAETLKSWFERFVENEGKARALYDERFCRMWRFYLLACEATFRYDLQAVFQIQITRQIDALPITRNYIYPEQPEAQHRTAAE